ncbi:(Fe-S)-binding protein [Carboxydothermus hydrogenoformans]|uniref:Glycolate oxidase iron-sulfur subunit n=1 Tax=Carboxydothermus hydrogenoformans (strain ATCC BAA-161 / DSM 6008 / Z-2901) TaxID=246194 RepID=Q3ACK1_CARHZ|nr:(Fe-S)-binding protein [Carboxydothermus hydrogenoformans]ABB15510.1 glycolate oxidase, iron-sulfur subunit [Carboxydothermus hydrogenoformans Z-2901]
MTQIKELLLRCNKCGLCQQSCPTYKVTKNEFYLARGRNRLMDLVLEKKYDWQKQIIYAIETCLQCGACVETCPSSVKTDLVMNLAKREIVKIKKQNILLKFAYKILLPTPQMIKIVGKFVKVYSKVKDKKVVKYVKRLNPINDLKRLERSLPNYRGEVGELKTKGKGSFNKEIRVGYFKNCANLLAFNFLDQSTFNVLKAVGIHVENLTNKCCGAPHWFSGDIETFRNLANYNLKNSEYQKYDFIVTDCATCGAILKRYGELLETKEAHEFAQKVIDINEFLVKNELLDYFEYEERSDVITVHDPCHLVREQKVKFEPRKIANMVPGVKLIEMKDSNMCCGGAGVFSITQPRMSDEILKVKIKNILETKANIVLAACPSCIMQLTRGVETFAPNSNIKVFHPIEYLVQHIKK